MLPTFIDLVLFYPYISLKFHIIFAPKSIVYVFGLLMQGDVYPVESSDGFTMNQVLDAHWGVLIDDDVRMLIAG